MRSKHVVYKAEARLRSVHIGNIMYAMDLVIHETALQNHLKIFGAYCRPGVLVIALAVCEGLVAHLWLEVIP